MPVLSYSTDDATLYRMVQGYIFDEEITEGLNIDVRNSISADIETWCPIVDYPYAAAWWSVAVQSITPLPPSVKVYTGDPPRYQLGSIVHENQGCYNKFYFLNYLQHSFPMQACLIRPAEYGPIPFNPDDLPITEPANVLLPFIRNGSEFNGVPVLYSNLRDNGGLTGNTGYRLYLEPDVLANVTLSYLVYAYTDFIEPGQNVVLINI